MQDIQTTGGIFTEEIRRRVVLNICKVFDCKESDIEDIRRASPMWCCPLD